MEKEEVSEIKNLIFLSVEKYKYSLFHNFIMAFFKDSKGYPRNKSTGKLIHRSVAEKKIGRPLRSHEVVHHKDGDKSNFSRRNLRVTSRSYHSKLHKKYTY